MSLTRLVIAVAVLCAAMQTAVSSGRAATTPPTDNGVPIYQNRDEPGRVPYQELQYGCDTNSCTLKFAKVPSAHRRVITNIVCDQFVPNNGSVYLAFLQSSDNTVYVPLLFTYGAAYNSSSGSIVIANLAMTLYFNQNTYPVVTFENGGTGSSLANAHCFLSGYNIGP